MTWREQILDPDALELDNYVRATYSISVSGGQDVRRAAVEMLRILTLRSQRDQFTKAELDPTSAGAVIHVGPVAPWTEVTLAFPVSHCEPREGLTHLLQLLTSSVEYSYTSGVWLQRVDLPRGHLLTVPGPKLGVLGIRQKLKVPSRPILALQVGPRRRPLDNDLVDAYLTSLRSGTDLLVDDILLGDPSGSTLSLQHRVPTLVDACNRAANLAGSPKMYLPCLTGSPEEVREKAEWAMTQGAGGFVVNGFTQGLGTLEDLSRSSQGTWLITTNMGSGMLSRPPEAPAGRLTRRVGVDEQVLSKMSRFAGADAVHTGTTGAECFDAPWSDAVRALSQPIAAGARQIPPSFRVAEGDLQMINIWPNMRELGADTIFEVQTALLADRTKIRDRTKKFIELLNGLTAVTDTSEALKLYRSLAVKDLDLQAELDAVDLTKW